MRRVRILAIGSEARQALPFLRSWKRAGHRITVLGDRRLSAAGLSRHVDRLVRAPLCNVDPAGFGAALLRLVRSGRYDVVFPFGHYTMWHCVEHKDELARHVRVPVADRDVFMRSFDKAQTMAFCMDRGIPCPQTYFPEREDLEAILARAALPLWLKPGIGIGAIGGRRIDTPDEARRYVGAFRQRYGEMILQDFIPQERARQLVCHVFLGADARLRACMISRKPRYFPLRGGTSTALESLHWPELADYCRRLFEGIGLTGIADADVIVDPRDGVPKVMEINPRVSCSIKIGFAAGIDYADMWLRLALGEPVPAKLEYPDGLVLRNLPQEILWYLASDRAARRHTSPPFWRFVAPNVVYQTLSADDPLTFAGFVINMLAKYRSPESRRRKFAGV